MRTRTRWARRALLLPAALLAWTVALDVRAEDETPQDEPDGTAKAEAAWLQTCQRCHCVPDKRYETDRGFLAQITETS